MYTMFLVAFMRAHCYVRYLGHTAAPLSSSCHVFFIYRAMEKRSKRKINEKYFCRCVEEMAQFGTMLIKSRTRNKALRLLRLSKSQSQRGKVDSQHANESVGRESHSRFDSITFSTSYNHLFEDIKCKCCLTSPQVCNCF